MRQLEFWIFMRYLIILLSIFRCDTDIAIICKKEVFIHFWDSYQQIYKWYKIYVGYASK